MSRGKYCILQRFVVFATLSAVGFATSTAGAADRGTSAVVAENASIHVLPNALGDVNQDSLLNLFDLLRVRDLAIGAVPPGSGDGKGDLNLDGIVDQSDLGQLRDVLLRRQGVPHAVTADQGGDVVGRVGTGSLTLRFGQDEVRNDLPMHIDDRTPAAIEAVTGVDFSLLEADSTYFMMGFQVEASNLDYVYPPQMDIQLNQLPPCNLQGSNLLMSARRGPSGNTELVLVSELQVTGANSVAVPPPAYPVIQLPQKVGQPSAQVAEFEQYEYMYLPATNFSQRVYGNAVLFKASDGRRWLANPVGYYPASASTWNEVLGLVVPVPEAPPGPYDVVLRHMGAVLESSPVHVMVRALGPPATGDPDAVIALLRSRYETFRAGSIPFFLENLDRPAYLRDVLAQLLDSSEWRIAIDSYFNVLATAAPDVRAHHAAIIEKSGVIARIENLIPQLTSASTPVLDRAVRETHIAAKRVMEFVVASPPPPHPSTAISVKGEDEPQPRCDEPLEISVKGDEVPVPKPSGPVHAAARGGTAGSKSFSARVLFAGAPPVGSTDGLASDASYDPRPLPNMCMNVWRHNTNAEGDATGPPDCPPASPSGLAKVSLAPVVKIPCSSLRDAIVTPVNGGIPGIVGVIDGAGAFAIPGLKPGVEVHFAVYDPRTGLFDPDAGYATSPNVAEQGRWFPVHLVFAPNLDEVTLPMDIGDAAADSITLDRQRVNYKIYVPEASTAQPLTLGFCAAAPLSFRLLDPAGGTVIENTNTGSLLQRQLTLTQPGTYTIRVAFGMSQQPARFAVGINRAPNYPLQQIGCSPAGVLPTAHSPFAVFGAAAVAQGDTLSVLPGTIVGFPRGTSLTGAGVLTGTATASLPIILRTDGTALGVAASDDSPPRRARAKTAIATEAAFGAVRTR